MPTVAVYGVPTWPLGNEEVEIASGAGLMAIATEPVAVSVGLLESVAFTVMFAVPDVVGVPETVHPLSRVRPAGKVPAAMLQL
jgi:hypothetical protein